MQFASPHAIFTRKKQIMSSSIRIGGVPEHYNAPFHKLMDSNENLFQWKSYPGGTGAMLEALENRDIDLAVLLTEGAIKHALCTNGSVRILGTFVNNPLPWGVHVSPKSGIKNMSELNAKISNCVFGISRFGSGSHLMAIVHAASLHGSSMPQFKIVHNMDGAAKAMEVGEIDVFLWDVATADKFARQGVWHVIGQVAGDWPSFVFVVRNDVDELVLEKMTAIIDSLKHAAISLTNGQEESVQYLCTKHGITETQSTEFLREISWNCNLELSKKVIDTVVESLFVSGIVTREQANQSESLVIHPTRCRSIE